MDEHPCTGVKAELQYFKHAKGLCTYVYTAMDGLAFLSRLKQGFDSPRGRQLNQWLTQGIRLGGVGCAQLLPNKSCEIGDLGRAKLLFKEDLELSSVY